MSLLEPTRAALIAPIAGRPPAPARRDPRPRHLDPAGHRERALRVLRKAKIEDALHRTAIQLYEQRQHEEPPTGKPERDPMPMIRSEERGERNASRAQAALDRVELFDRTGERRADWGAEGGTYGAWEGGNGGPNRSPYPSASTGALRGL